MKTDTEIIEQIKKAIPVGVHKFYLNGLLWCLGRDDLGIFFDERMTEKRINKILKELEESKWKKKKKDYGKNNQE